MKRYLIGFIVTCLLFSCSKTNKQVNTNDEIETMANDGISFKLILNMPESMVDQQIKIIASDTKAEPLRTYEASGNHLDVEVKFEEANLYQVQIGNRYPIPFLVSGEEQTIEFTIKNNSQQLDYDVVKSEETKIFHEYMRQFSPGAGISQVEKVEFLDSISPSYTAAHIYSYEFDFFGFLYVDKLEKIKKTYKDKVYAKALFEAIDKLTAGTLGYGKPIPDFLLPSITGEGELGPSSFKGKYLLIDFWASWCGPCRKENPNVRLAYAAYKDKGFEVLGVSTDRTDAPWKQAVGKDGITWNQVRDHTGEVASKFEITSIPTIYLVNPKGIIVGKNVRGPALETALEYFLGK